jgi:hypothetical protein
MSLRGWALANCHHPLLANGSAAIAPCMDRQTPALLVFFGKALLERALRCVEADGLHSAQKAVDVC